MRKIFKKLHFRSTRLTPLYKYTFDASRLSIPIAGVLQRNQRGCTSSARSEAAVCTKFANALNIGKRIFAEWQGALPLISSEVLIVSLGRQNTRVLKSPPRAASLSAFRPHASS